MSSLSRPLLFLLFFVSGFCSLVYQVVWTRLAFASFGIITPVLSVVISVFMLGLAVGAWAGGRWIGPLTERTRLSAAAFYALAECIIGLGAFAVPHLFAAGERLLLRTGESDSLPYLSLSALVLAGSILPWCIAMGTTFPWMMAYVREHEPKNLESFSFLYLANVLGAMSGTILTAVALIEIFGFRDTLRVTACGNFLVAALAARLAFNRPAAQGLKVPSLDTPAAATGLPDRDNVRLMKGILFTTGFVSMSMEVVWMRAFTPVLKTQVYSFASVVATYLGATFLGSLIYRRHLRARRTQGLPWLLGLLCVSAFLPVLANDTRWVTANCWELYASPASVLLLLASICPFCGILGYLTPALVDQYAGGSPRDAGAAYALNVLGCILGPLFACYAMLPAMSERHALILLGLPFLAFFFRCGKAVPHRRRLAVGWAAGVAVAVAGFYSRSFEDNVFRTGKHPGVHRDYAASVLSFGDGFEKVLAVNGLGMTTLTPITKFMAHLPLLLRPSQPESALVICFGMGTTFRSVLSWDVETTAVELVPGVRDAFGFYFADAPRFLSDPKARVVIDDGRRFLERTRGKFDVIVIDPPPPVQAAGSSLLYSEEFYAVAKQRLKPGGILQAWVPGKDAVAQATLRSFRNSFPYVRCFDSLGGCGLHLLGSLEPISVPASQELAARMPARAGQDLLEWSDSPDLPAYLNRVLGHEIPLDGLRDAAVGARITDDQPYNEYYLLRSLGLF